MTDNPFEDPQWKEYAAHVRETLIPMIKDSAVTLSLVPSDNVPDPKFAVELGYMIMLDKPIIAIVNPGSKVPLKLVKVADEIVEGAPGEPDFEKRFMPQSLLAPPQALFGSPRPGTPGRRAGGEGPEPRTDQCPRRHSLRRNIRAR